MLIKTFRKSSRLTVWHGLADLRFDVVLTCCSSVHIELPMFSHRLRLTEPKAKAQATFSEDKHAKNICRWQPSCALWTKTPPRLLVVTHSDQGMWKVLWSPRNNPEHMQMGNYTNNINKIYNIIHIQRTSLFAILPCMVLPTYCLSFSMLNLPWWPSRHCVEFYDFYVLQVPGSKSI